MLDHSMNLSSDINLSRVGCVSYLNARPLIYGLEDRVKLEVPSLLATDLHEDRLDAALIPIAEYLVHPRYQIIPGIAIGCRGPVLSVYLAHRKPLAKLKSVTLDDASKTSNLLLQVILRDIHGLTPNFVSPTENADPDGRLFIGDPALLAREDLAKNNWTLLDLGEAWCQATGLPFTFAVWAVRDGLDGLPYLELFTRAKREGLGHMDAIAMGQTLLPPKAARHYLTHHVAYDFGTAEVDGLLEFKRRCVGLGLIPCATALKLAA